MTTASGLVAWLLFVAVVCVLTWAAGSPPPDIPLGEDEDDWWPENADSYPRDSSLNGHG